MTRYNSLRFYLKLGVGPWLRYWHFRRFVRRYLLPFSPISILDAGFGQGDYLAWLGQHLPAAQIAGYDLAATQTYANNFEITRRKIKTRNVSLHPQNLLTMSDQDRFDVVYSIDVLEHIPNNRQVMENIFQALKPNGLFYLAMPHNFESQNIFPRRFFRQFEAWTREEHIGEMRSLTESETLLKEIGFKVLESRYTFGFFARFAWEVEQLTKLLPGQPAISRLRRPVLNLLTMLDFVVPPPSVGSAVRIICQK